MAKEIKEIQELLDLCIEMDSPSMVISVSTIEKHFPAPRLAIDPTKPCYDLGVLKEWAKEKGWSISFATTPSKDSKRILPAIKFTPLTKINSVPSSTPEPTANNTNAKHDWHNMPLGKIALAAIGITLGTMVLYLIRKYIGIDL